MPTLEELRREVWEANLGIRHQLRLAGPFDPWAVADDFGAEIPCLPYVDNGGDRIGEAIVKHMGKTPVILLSHHDAFTWGATPRAASKAAVLLENVAKTCHLALLLGKFSPLPPEEVHKWHTRYHTTYGQEKRP